MYSLTQPYAFVNTHLKIFLPQMLERILSARRIMIWLFPAESRLSHLYRVSELASGNEVGFKGAMLLCRVWDRVPADSKGRAFGGSRAEPL